MQRREFLLNSLGGVVAAAAAARQPLAAAIPGRAGQSQTDRYFPPPETAGGWRTGDARTLGLDPDRLREALRYHDESILTTTTAAPSWSSTAATSSPRAT